MFQMRPYNSFKPSWELRNKNASFNFTVVFQSLPQFPGGGKKNKATHLNRTKKEVFLFYHATVLVHL